MGIMPQYLHTDPAGTEPAQGHLHQGRAFKFLERAQITLVGGGGCHLQSRALADTQESIQCTLFYSVSLSLSGRGWKVGPQKLILGGKACEGPPLAPALCWDPLRSLGFSSSVQKQQRAIIYSYRNE